MLTKKIRVLVKQTILAAFILGAAGPAIAAAQTNIAVAAKQETILAPLQTPAGCWTDEGYGRLSSCDAG